MGMERFDKMVEATPKAPQTIKGLPHLQNGERVFPFPVRGAVPYSGKKPGL